MLTQRARYGLLVPGYKIAAPVEVRRCYNDDWAGCMLEHAARRAAKKPPPHPLPKRAPYVLPITM